MKALNRTEEQETVGMLRDALVRLMRAEDLCIDAGHSPDVLTYVKNARDHTQRALDLVLGVTQRG